ncbi:Uncharacterised protein [Legionella beliardensis]|uniref:Uncharacterized protein n=1 Tax=Legionella beliardensis TaxID=91822 RepID=A0A378HZX4_9GAMM|nr:hypothetical protein [Legionella beliardensis]STX28498.1 Uncharacterised protein [Legionella beliardensis]
MNTKLEHLNVTLSTVLSLIGYHATLEKLAYIKLLAYRNCFKNLPLAYQYAGNIIDDFAANYLLTLPFYSLEEGFHWLANTLDEFCLRQTMKYESITDESEGINTKRWEEKEESIDCILEHPQSKAFQLYQSAKSLGFINAKPLKKESHVKHIVLISSISKFIKERIDCLPDIEGNLYFLTGPRGVFNHEKSLAAILAHWLNKPNRKQAIATLLNQHKNSCDPLQWHQNLSGLKKKILEGVGLQKWPEAQQSYYYLHQDKYDLAAKLAGREPLNCLGGAWPVAADLGAYYLKKYFNGRFPLKFIPVVALGQGNKLTTMDDTISTWLNDYGFNLIEQGEEIAFILDNRMHILPFARQYLLHQATYQNALTKKNLENKLASFVDKLSGKQYKQVKFYASESRYFNENWLFDALAKAIFPLKNNIKRHIDAFINVYRFKYPQRFIKEMIHHHQFKDYLRLTSSSVDFSFNYNSELEHKDLVKTGGLLNFAINVAKRLEDKKTATIKKLLCRATLKNIENFIQPTPLYFSYKPLINRLHTEDYLNKKFLANIRQSLSLSFKENLSLKKLYKLATKNMQKFFTLIVKQSCDLLNIDLMHFAFVYLGSNARKQNTPFTDIEFFIIIKHDDLFHLAKEVTKLILLKILNLRETVLPMLGITIQDEAGNLFSFSGALYDYYTKEGFCFDGNQPQACKTPLGKKVGSDVIFRLIGTAPTLVNNFASQQGFNFDIYFPQLMRLSRFICGNKALYGEFISALETSTLDSRAYSQALIQHDLAKYLPCLRELNQLHQINHKKYLYRPMVIFIDDLIIALGINRNLSSTKKINLLAQYGLINEKMKAILFINLSYVLRVRLQQHLNYNEQKIYFSKQENSAYTELISMQEKLTKHALIPIMKKITLTESLLLKRESKLSRSYFNFFKSDRNPSPIVCKQEVSTIRPTIAFLG